MFSSDRSLRKEANSLIEQFISSAKEVTIGAEDEEEEDGDGDDGASGGVIDSGTGTGTGTVLDEATHAPKGKGETEAAAAAAVVDRRKLRQKIAAAWTGLEVARNWVDR